MKTKLLFAIAFFCISSNAFSGEGEGKTNQIVGWVPDHGNAYSFRVVEINRDTAVVVVEGRINNASILSVINLRGQELYRKELKPLNGEYIIRVPISKLGKGNYFLKIDASDEIRLKHLVMGRAGSPLLVTTSVED